MSLPVTDGLVLHLDADAIEGLNDGDTVETWEDLSGEGNDATQATEANRPTYKVDQLNGKPVLVFDGTNDYFDLPVALNAAFNSTDGLTVYFVLRATTYSTWICSLEIVSRFFIFRTNAEYADFRRSTADDMEFLDVDDVQNGEPHVVGAIYSPGVERYLRLDGEMDRYHDSAAAMPGGTNSDPVNLGRDTRGNEYHNGDMAEILIYDRALSTAEREEVEQYLGEKWLGWEPETVDTVISLPYKTINTEKHPFNITTTENVRIVLPHKATQVTEYIPTVRITKSIEINAPPQMVTTDSYAPEVKSTKNISIDISSKSVSTVTYEPSINTTENINIDIPHESISITKYEPTISAAKNTSINLPKKDIVTNIYPPDIIAVKKVTIVLPYKQVETTVYNLEVYHPVSIVFEIPKQTVNITKYEPVIEAIIEYISEIYLEGSIEKEINLSGNINKKIDSEGEIDKTINLEGSIVDKINLEGNIKVKIELEAVL